MDWYVKAGSFAYPTLGLRGIVNGFDLVILLAERFRIFRFPLLPHGQRRTSVVVAQQVFWAMNIGCETISPGLDAANRDIKVTWCWGSATRSRCGGKKKLTAGAKPYFTHKVLAWSSNGSSNKLNLFWSLSMGSSTCRTEFYPLVHVCIHDKVRRPFYPWWGEAGCCQSVI